MPTPRGQIERVLKVSIATERLHGVSWYAENRKRVMLDVR